MKNWLRKNMFTICNICLGYTVWYRISSMSNFLFGEPEFPIED